MRISGVQLFFSDSGYQLRQDDPSALKDIVEIVHGKVAAQDKETVRFVKHLLLHPIPSHSLP